LRIYALAVRDELYGENRILEIANSGGFDGMSGSCMANLSVAYWYAHSGLRVSKEVGHSLREKAFSQIQKALEEEPDSNPRYYEQLGNMYLEDNMDLALETW
jgi:hypothetical protein